MNDRKPAQRRTGVALEQVSRSVGLEPLEDRRLLSIAPYATLVDQNGASSAYPKINGSGQTVAMIDTGIDYKLPELGGGFGKGFKVEAGYDFYSNDSDPMDEDGHGTETAATVAANSYTVNGVTYSGVAPAAKLIALRVGTESDISFDNIKRALDWVIKYRKTYGITVVNLSLGASSYTSAHDDSTLSADFATLAKANVFVVAASGNSNDQQSGPVAQEGIAYPAADANVFAVGAVDATDVITTWSQRGSELDLLAPGASIELPKLGGGYEAVDGTSFSSPYVAGAAALVRQAAPWASAADVASILMTSGVDNRDGDNETGNVSDLLFARLDIKAAIDLAVARTPKYDSLDVGTMFDTALDSKGVLHVAYYDQSTNTLKYAVRDAGGKWSSPITVDSHGRVGSYPSIAVDSTGKVAISYYDLDNTALKVATFDGVHWALKTVDGAKSVGTYTSAAYDVYGNLYVAYYKKSGGSLKLGTEARDAGTWSTQTIDDSSSNIGMYASLDVTEAATGGNGIFTRYDTTVAIAYEDETNKELKYARRFVTDSTQSWILRNVAAVNAAHIDLNLHAGPSSTGVQAQIAYQDTKNDDVKYSYKVADDQKPTDWVTETVASAGNVGASVQLSFDSSDSPEVTYFNGTKRVVYTAARSSSGSWSSDKIATSSGYISVGYNERTGDAIVTLLNRTKKSVFSDTLV